jgi:hypothetical protein
LALFVSCFFFFALGGFDGWYRNFGGWEYLPIKAAPGLRAGLGDLDWSFSQWVLLFLLLLRLEGIAWGYLSFLFDMSRWGDPVRIMYRLLAWLVVGQPVFRGCVQDITALEAPEPLPSGDERER